MIPTIIELVARARQSGDWNTLISTVPYARFLGITLEERDGALRGRMKFADHLVGNPTIPALHGGTLGALLELAAQFELMYRAQTLLVPKTITLTIDYLRSGRATDTYVRAKTVRQGRRVSTVSAWAWQEDETQPIVQATVKQLVMGVSFVSNERVVPSDPLRKSVVKLFTVTRKPNHYEPWSHGYQHASGGSGCIIEGNRILTNAHVVTNAVFIQALKNGDVKKYVAKVEHVSHDEELAVLTVDDATFFADTTPVSWGGLPMRQDRVHVYGFPIGGNELSITAGVISRVEVISYTHSRRWLLALQTDAAINPGNSGGPVFSDGKLVGVAFQSHERTTAQSTGYVVPMPVIEHFRREVKAGVCLGVPSLGVFWQKIESEALRDHAQLKAKQSGVLISRVMYGGSAHGLIREGDVLLTVAGTRIEQDGTIILRGEDRVDFSHLVSQRRIGEPLTVELLRKGKKLKVKVTMRGPSALVPLPRPERQPTYFVFAGLMFVPLTSEYLASWDWKDVDVRFQHLYRDGLQTPQRREVVIVSHVLAHSANQGYHDIRGAIVEKVNGKHVREMKDVVKAVKKPVGKLHVIEFDNSLYTFGSHVALKAAEIESATKEVLATYGVTKDRSPDLEDL